MNNNNPYRFAYLHGLDIVSYGQTREETFERGRQMALNYKRPEWKERYVIAPMSKPAFDVCHVLAQARMDFFFGIWNPAVDDARNTALVTYRGMIMTENEALILRDCLVMEEAIKLSESKKQGAKRL